MNAGSLDLDRLRDLALRDRWTLEHLAWKSVNFAGLPEEFRQIAADAFAQLRWGERTAELSARTLVARNELTGPARAFVETQIADEQRHVGFFDKVIEQLGCPGRVRPSVQRLMQEVEEAASPEERVLGMHILIEGVAQSLFTEAGKWFEALDSAGELEDPLLSMKRVVGQWMPILLARDESRHIAFGLHFLRARVPELGFKQRQHLEDKLAVWGEAVLDQARDPDLIEGAGIDGDALCGPLVEDMNLRISQIGLSTRISALKAA